ncbi:MAG TPA: glycosyl hydrolase [Methylomirabilota bacterium]|jgi:photosystem II stability/assembly factor-like uncharacterized protein
MDPARFQGLRWRCIGPPRGGRVVAVAGHPTEPMVFYFGAVAGGVWKTTDGGTYWENISDGYFRTAAVGALAVAESDPSVIYAGTGEATIRIDVSYGDGVYRSTDGGKTWSHAGLADSRHIGKIQVHPQDPDLVYVAALGHAFGPSAERGVYRSRDGGRTWQQILFRSERAGAIDLALDRRNPRILYASMWEVYRHFWTLSSGGPDSRIYKSSDGGDTWTDLTDNPGLPGGIKGKIGVAVSPARPDRVWAIIEADKAGLYRSDDAGRTWELVSDNRDLIHRPWYYCHVFADPADPDTVYVTNLRMWKSTDGGRTFTEVTTPHGDNHDLWIDPRDPRRMIEGNDGGACVSFNGGQSWSTIYNQLTAQFYHVAIDDQHPYRVYGTQQDNSSVSVPSASENGGITWGDCYPAGTGESGYIAVHPRDPNVVYVGAVGSSPGGGGALQRYDHRTRQIRLVTVWPEVYYGWGPKDLRYRFAWTFPIVFSPHDPGTLYATGNLVFRTRDEGSSWEAISPDLTRQDATKLEASGGPLTKDTSGAEHYGTVYAFAESPRERGVLWAGSDDGLVHVSRDDGKTWQNVTPPDLPEWSLIATIEPSGHAPGAVYVAATRYKIDDYGAYLYKSEDYGRTWRALAKAFPAGEISRVIREDPVRPGLLYAGTETGIVVSWDDGGTWHRLSWNLPVAPVYDLAIKGSDLVAATHGRSFWILDDLTPLRELTADATGGIAHLFPPRPTVRPWQNWSVDLFRGPGKAHKNYMMALGTGLTFYEDKTPEGERIRTFLDAGENPPTGAIVYYTLGDKTSGSVSLTFLDAKGTAIRTFTTKPESPPAADAGSAAATAEVVAPALPPADERYLTARPGLNRFVWDLRYPGAEKVPGDVSTEKAITGPLASPGRYTVRLGVGDRSWTQAFEVRKDPRVPATQADLDAQFALWCRIRDTLSDTHAGINRLRRIRRQVNEWSQRLRGSSASNGPSPGAAAGAAEPRAAGQAGPDAGAGAIAEAAKRLLTKLAEIETELVQTSARNSMDALRWPARLNLRLASLVSVLSSADAAPPKQAFQVYEHLAGLASQELARLDALVETDVRDFNTLVREANLPAIATR